MNHWQVVFKSLQLVKRKYHFQKLIVSQFTVNFETCVGNDGTVPSVCILWR
jgi:hypothetical protein